MIFKKGEGIRVEIPEEVKAVAIKQILPADIDLLALNHRMGIILKKGTKKNCEEWEYNRLPGYICALQPGGFLEKLIPTSHLVKDKDIKQCPTCKQLWEKE